MGMFLALEGVVPLVPANLNGALALVGDFALYRALKTY